MTAPGLLQIIVFFAIILLLTKPIGIFMARVYEGERTVLTPALLPVERLIYKLSGVKATEEQGWRGYTVSMLLFNLMGLLLSYFVFRLQAGLPLNPQGLDAVSPDLSFNTAVSFTTNTNWQSYSGESTMSYLSQMVGLAVHNFTSAAAGMGVAVAVARGLTRRRGPDAPRTIGNFWADLVRAIVYVLLPASVVLGLFLASQGVLQTLAPYREVVTLEGAKQVLALGPVASQEVIKQLGTNGGGFFNANSAHPFENPTPLANFV